MLSHLDYHNCSSWGLKRLDTGIQDGCPCLWLAELCRTFFPEMLHVKSLFRAIRNPTCSPQSLIGWDMWSYQKCSPSSSSEDVLLLLEWLCYVFNSIKIVHLFFWNVFFLLAPAMKFLCIYNVSWHYRFSTVYHTNINILIERPESKLIIYNMKNWSFVFDLLN
jgi:hypothetical protein